MKLVEDFLNKCETYMKNGSIDIKLSIYTEMDKDSVIQRARQIGQPIPETGNKLEEKILQEWDDMNEKHMNDFKELYNKTRKQYNDYCGQRAGESTEMLDLVVGGYSISNVIPFRTTKTFIEKKSKNEK